MTITVTGGTVSTDGAYTIRTFETWGTLTISGGTLTDVQFLLIAGGGRAAVPTSSYVAGGGAGGVVSGIINLDAGSYPVVVGAPTCGSSFNNFVAIPGGTGGFYGNGFPGGSGGGGGVLGTVHINFQNFVGGPGDPTQGCNGGNPFGGGYPGGGPGGGGGAGGPGGQGSAHGVGGDGGIGISSTITGTQVYYAGGGTAKGPGGIGNNNPGWNNYGAGGGYSGSQNDNAGTLLLPQPGVLILRYLT
jgi:hypothetical protein